MLLRTPLFYSQFQCIAGKCTDTCCVGWEIDVDEMTLNKYKGLAETNELAGNCSDNTKDVPEEARVVFARNVLKNIKDGHFILKPGDRCPFLKENGLCEMICNLGCNGTDLDENGESILCDICREHPRFVEVYGDIMEKGLGLCCEEAARLLLTSGTTSASHPEEQSDEGSSNALPLVESEIAEEPDEMPDGAEEARDAIFEERETIFAILNNKSIPLNERLIEILDFAVAVSDNEEFPDTNENHSEDTLARHSERSEESSLSIAAIRQTWIEILGEGESYGPAWDTAYEQMIRTGWPSPSHPEEHSDEGPSNLAPESHITQSLFTDEDGARIVAYLIFRYYAKSLFDGDSLTKVQFAIYFWIMVQKFGNILGNINPDGSVIDPAANQQTVKINAVKLFSKQTEYSEEIMEILADNFFQNPAFSVEQFHLILSATSSSTNVSP